ncbi:methyltransferase domain-containing protein [Paracoccus methylarcula]|nr:methyltransferase domain-containing protein [Paracoccus methylarcula]
MSAIAAPRIRRSFERSFDSYHRCATQQAAIARFLIARLAAKGAPDKFENVFEFGCGTGHLTQALRRSFQVTRLSLNDLAMPAAETAATFNAEFICGDLRDIAWPEAPDLILSASTIQWLDDPASLARRAAERLRPGGWLAISGFGPSQYRELSGLGFEPQAPGLCRPETLADALCDTGVTIVETGERLHRLTFDTPMDVLRHLRATGVNAGSSRNWTRGDLNRFSRDYIRQFGGPGGVPLTYHPIWIIARRNRRDQVNRDR